MLLKPLILSGIKLLIDSININSEVSLPVIPIRKEVLANYLSLHKPARMAHDCALSSICNQICWLAIFIKATRSFNRIYFFFSFLHLFFGRSGSPPGQGDGAYRGWIVLGNCLSDSFHRLDCRLGVFIGFLVQHIEEHLIGLLRRGHKISCILKLGRCRGKLGAATHMVWRFGTI